MKDSKPNNRTPLESLSPELMEGYVNGTLSSDERRRVEKFLENNPFEAEALEGLQATGVNLSNDLSELEERLAKKVDSKTSTYSWFGWPMAAAISLLVISGGLFYFMNLDQPSDQVAVNEETTKNHMPPGITEESEILDVPADPTESAAFEQQDEDTKPDAPKENVRSEDVPVEVSADFEANDQPTTIDQLSIPEKEIVDLESSRARKSVAAAPVTARNSTEPAPALFAKIPEEMMDYLASNTNYPDSALARGITGSVQLTFMVGPDGTLSDIQVIKGLGHGCDQEAIRALKDGPTWEPNLINGVPVKTKGLIEVFFPAKQ